MSLSLDRRQFLATAGALALPTLATAQAPADPFGGLKVGAQTYTFRQFTLDQALVRMQRLGLRYAELYERHAPSASTPAQIKALLKLCADHGVTPLAWGVHRFTRDHDANKRMFEFGKALGLRMFSADPTADAFDSLDRLCAEFGIAIGIHPHGPVGPAGKRTLHPWHSAEAILKAVRDRHRLVGACLDTGHLIRAAQLGARLDPAAQVRLMGARNFGVHLKDHDNRRMTDVVFGEGALNVRAVVAALRAVRFEGLISIEYEANPAEPTNDVRACLKVLQGEAARP